MRSIAAGRLGEERKAWRKDHPINFYARPLKDNSGGTNLFVWECGIPGPKGTDWEGGLFKVVMTFSDDYPAAAPVCKFSPPIFHCNVFASGGICLDLLNGNWKAGITIKQILLAIQHLLDHPNPEHVTDRPEASRLLNSSPSQYSQRIRAQTAMHAPTELED